jgi:hypothetical protein
VTPDILTFIALLIFIIVWQLDYLRLLAPPREASNFRDISSIAMANILNASCRDLSGFELISEEWSSAVFFDMITAPEVIGFEAVPGRFRNPRFIQDSIVLGRGPDIRFKATPTQCDTRSFEDRDLSLLK